MREEGKEGGSNEERRKCEMRGVKEGVRVKRIREEDTDKTKEES